MISPHMISDEDMYNKEIMAQRKVDLQQAAYEAYKLDWMIYHGYSLKDYLNALIFEGEAARANHEFPEGDFRDTLEILDSSFEYEHGFDGELWACKDEFLDAEFKEEEYMEHLFTMMRKGKEYAKVYYELKQTQSRPWYFTFGTAAHYPYKDEYLIVLAKNGDDALTKFRSKYPDYRPGILNCSEVYSEDEFFLNDSWFAGRTPADIIGDGWRGELTWDNIFVLAEDAACGSEELRRKDFARSEISEWVRRAGLPDIEDCEVPEDEIDRLCSLANFSFYDNGQLGNVECLIAYGIEWDAEDASDLPENVLCPLELEGDEIAEWLTNKYRYFIKGIRHTNRVVNK